jgi:hypothetical protein
MKAAGHSGQSYQMPHLAVCSFGISDLRATDDYPCGHLVGHVKARVGWPVFMGPGDAASRCRASDSLPRAGVHAAHVLRTLLEQSEGVDNELVTEGQERPVRLRSARARDSAGRRCGFVGMPWHRLASRRQKGLPSLSRCFVCSGLPSSTLAQAASKACSPSMSVCTFPYAIVANALFCLAGSSALAPPLGGEVERGERSLWVRRIWGRGSTDGVGRPIARGRGPPADAFLKAAITFVVQASGSSFPRRFRTRSLSRPPPHRWPPERLSIEDLHRPSCTSFPTPSSPSRFPA